MQDIAKETIDILQYLLPGFLAAWIWYGLTPYAKPAEFERVVQALIFTLVIEALVFAEKRAIFSLGLEAPDTWSVDAQLVASTASALIVGLLFAYGANSDVFHAAARRFGITIETSFASEWYGAFATNITYVVLQLTDERRLYGWPIEWPSDPKEGHFVLKQVSWLTEDGEVPLTGVASMLVNVRDVKWVEFMDKTWEE